MAIRTFLFACCISALLIIHGFSSATSPPKTSEDLELEEDLKLLTEDESPATGKHSDPDPDHYSDEDEFENYDDVEGSEDSYDHSPPQPEIDEKDVVVLTEGNFSDFLEKNRYLMVEFYAPWCGHCQALAPEYAAAATELKGEVVLAKVDATEENDLAQQYDVQGFPTVLFFVDGVHKPYPGQRNKDAIVTWIKKKTGPGIHNVTTTEDAERILTSENKLVLGFLESLVVLSYSKC